MRPGTKKWVMFMQKTWYASQGIIVLCIALRFLLWQTPSMDADLIKSITNIVIIICAIVMAIHLFLSMFAPIKEKPNWELVYPELSMSHDPDFDLNAFIEEKAAKEKK